MRIVHHFSNLHEGGGVPRAVLDLVRLLVASGIDASVLTAAGQMVPDDFREGELGGARVTALEPIAGPFERLSRAGRRRAAEVLRAADILHLHGTWRPRNAQLARLASKMGVRYVLSPHGMLSDWGMSQRTLNKKIYYRFVERRTLAEARYVHVTARREGEETQKWVPHDRLVVIPVAVDLAPFSDLPGKELFEQEHPGLRSDRPRILFLSRLHHKKRPDLLIESTALLSRQGVQCELLLAGDGDPDYVESLRRLSRQLDIADRTHFLGLVLGREKLSLFQACDLMALPTLQENFGLVLFESLACGTPVLTTRGADTWQEIAEGGGGRIAPATVEEFARTLSELVTNRNLCADMGRRGREWALRWLDPENVIPRYEQLYRDAARL